MEIRRSADFFRLVRDQEVAGSNPVAPIAGRLKNKGFGKVAALALTENKTMGDRISGRVPKLCRHKASNRAYVTDPGSGKPRYFGTWGTDDAREGYSAWLKEFIRASRRMEEPASPAAGKPESMAGLLAKFWVPDCRAKYKKVDGSPTGELSVCKGAARAWMAAELGTIRLAECNRHHIVQFRDYLVGRKLSDKTIREYIGRILRALGFAEQRDWIDSGQLVRLHRWPRLRPHETRAPKTVSPIPLYHLKRLYLSLPKRWQTILAFHLLTGQRAESALWAHGAEINRRVIPWEYSPRQHKGAWRGHDLTIFIGPRCRDILEPALERAGKGPLFPGKAGRLQRWSYLQAFERACQEAKIPHYSPRQVRHTAASFLVDQGVEERIIAAILGHRATTITQRYARAGSGTVAKVVEKYG